MFDCLSAVDKDSSDVDLRAAPSPAPETIGERLRRLRLERGLSQRQLASPGVSYAYISRIEAGARRPSVKALRQLAPKLGVSVEYLETGSDLRESDAREMLLADAELELRLAEDPSEAEKSLGEILAEAEHAGDATATTRARIGLGFAASRRGDAQSAVDQLERALESPTVDPSARPDVYTALGRAYAALGAPQRAAGLFERCLDEVTSRTPDDAAAQVRFAVYLSHALGDLGEFERAEAVLRDALDRVDEFEDPMTRVRLYRSLARLAAFEGRPATALENLRRAIALLEATEDTQHLARAHLGCAYTLNATGRAAEAGPHLDAAERLFGPNAEALDRAYLRTEQAKRAAQLGEPDEAVGFASEALEILGDADPAERGNAHFALGQALALKGKSKDADESYRHAVQLLEQHGQRRECATAMRAWAKFLRAEGREAEALDVLDRAAELGAAEPARAPART